jgi:aspartyl protease family protein
MAGDDIASLLYLTLLASVIGGYFLLSNRNRLGQVAQQAVVWGLIFVGVVAAVGLVPQLREGLTPRQSYVGTPDGGARIEVPLGPDGHYHIRLAVNGTDVPFIVDTGASDMVLSRADARRVGIDPDALAYLGRAQTANGTVPLARVTLSEVRLGEVTDRNVVASVNGGDMDGSLLGMSYLSTFGRIEISGGRLILER